MRRPLIGLTGRRFQLSLIDGADPRYGNRCVDAHMADFATRVTRSGGVPVNLTYDTDPYDVCEWLSGVVITGGQDVHPACWGGDASVVRGVDPRADMMVHDRARDDYEIELARCALARGLAVLGVCRGMQVLNVALGGTLVADLAPSSVRHLSPATAPTDGDADHAVTFSPGSLAAELFGERVVTNSWHHQAVDVCGTSLVVTGRAADGVPEAIELPGRPVLGVQWHPEWMRRDDESFDWIVRAAEGVTHEAV